MAHSNPVMRKKILALAAADVPVSKICETLCVTKNAVVGHLCRERNRNGAGPSRSQSRRRAQALPGAAAAESPLRSAPPPPMNKACRFIAGEKGKDFLLYGDPGVFCGEMVRDGSAYFPHYHRKTHTRPYTKEGGPFAHTGAGAAGTR